MKFAPNFLWYNDVLAAQHEAEADRLGLHSPTIACTVPAQVFTTMTQLQQVAPPTASTSAVAAGGLAKVVAAIALAERLGSLLDDRSARKVARTLVHSSFVTYPLMTCLPVEG